MECVHRVVSGPVSVELKRTGKPMEGHRRGYLCPWISSNQRQGCPRARRAAEGARRVGPREEGIRQEAGEPITPLERQPRPVMAVAESRQSLRRWDMVRQRGWRRGRPARRADIRIQVARRKKRKKAVDIKLSLRYSYSPSGRKGRSTMQEEGHAGLSFRQSFRARLIQPGTPARADIADAARGRPVGPNAGRLLRQRRSAALFLGINDGAGDTTATWTRTTSRRSSGAIAEQIARQIQTVGIEVKHVR